LDQQLHVKDVVYISLKTLSSTYQILDDKKLNQLLWRFFSVQKWRRKPKGNHPTQAHQKNIR